MATVRFAFASFSAYRPLDWINRTIIVLIAALAATAVTSEAHASISCTRTVKADVVAIDQPLMFNRLGAQNVNGMVFALKRDVVDESQKPLTKGGSASPAHVFLRPDKRPRPLTLRVAAGDCLNVTVTNLLTSESNPRHEDALPFATPSAVHPKAPEPNGKDVKPFGVTKEFDVTKGDSRWKGVDDQVADRMVGFHVQGLQFVNAISDDSSMVGVNPNSLLAPGQTATYALYAEHEGTFLVSSHGATFGGDATAGNSANGLFGAVNVEPPKARIYRSQMTDEELRLAASTDPTSHIGGTRSVHRTADGQPLVDYEAIYPSVEPWISEGKAGLPILNMLQNDEHEKGVAHIVHSDINAIIAGPDTDGSWKSLCPEPLKPGEKFDRPTDEWKDCPYPLERVGRHNPSLPNRLEPFREFTVVFHDEMSKQNAFDNWYKPIINQPGAVNKRNPLHHTLKAVGDVFMINYGSGGIGSEMIANRAHVGPMHDCLGCSAEEFFLTSHAVGDPAMVVDIPANFGMEQCWPEASVDGKTPTGMHHCDAQGPKASRAYYPDDPSNVHHSYISDHVKFRNVHTGKEHHIFHLHNHQWLYNPNDDNANYLDAQAIGPGSGYTYEINFGGSGNRNKSAGDAIFHCHLYPHFAQGMWELWRNHDVLETGTPLEVSGGADKFHTKLFGLQDGMPMKVDSAGLARARALPDGEIVAGTPIPAIVPLPGKAMAPMPGKVTVVAKTQQVTQKFSEDDPGRQVPAGSVAKVDRSDVRAEEPEDNVETPLKHPLNPTHLNNPGFPFWIAGVEHSVGQRPPTPPLDMMPKADDSNYPNKPDPTSNPDLRWVAGGWDGGLPRHTLDGYAIADAAHEKGKSSAHAGSEEQMPPDIHVTNSTRLDLSKKVEVAKPIWFAEDGTDLERVAMAFHAKRDHKSWAGDISGNPTPKNFITNGSGRPVAGAPFHDPCIDDAGKLMNGNAPGSFFDGFGGLTTTGSSPFTAANPRVYKGADIQFDAVLNKAGWHFPQERIVALWEDAKPIISKAKAPEPLVMRSNTFDCTMFLHTNLVPERYELDDFEVRTSTDIIGQHIHLPKWDLTTTDGSGNGWNYEDGTLSPGAVRERIRAINFYYRLQKESGQTPVIKDVDAHPVFLSKDLTTNGPAVTPQPKGKKELEPLTHPFFEDIFPPKASDDDRSQYWKGARTTLQRWFFDPVVNAEGTHRGLGIIFTHDHFGPSTHQQVGLYATVLVEPPGSLWTHNETDTLLFDEAKRKDGGPTSWQAMIKTGQKDGYVVDGKPAAKDIDKDGEDDSYREFYLEYSDFQHAYLPGKYVGADRNGAIKGFDDKLVVTPTGERKLSFEVRPLAETDKDGDKTAPDENSYKFAINPPVKDYSTAALNEGKTLATYANQCPPELGVGPEIPRPCPEAITADDPGTMVVNYRNEPIGLRIQDTVSGGQAAGAAGDLAYALQTFTKHRHHNASGDPAERGYRVLGATFGKAHSDGRRNVLHAQPRGGDRIISTCFPAVLQPNPGESTPNEPCKTELSDGKASAASVAKKGDPFTPLMRAYYGDRVRLKVQAGGDEETHNVTLHGLKWLQGGSGFGFDPNSGWRNSQQAGISEQFTFAAPLLPPPSERSLKISDRGIAKAMEEAAKPMTRDRSVVEDEAHDKTATPDEDEVRKRQKTDYLYAVDASTEGYWNGTWGLIRAYGKERTSLASLPNNSYKSRIETNFDKVKWQICPDTQKSARRHFDVAAVLANDVLDNAVGATLPPGAWSSYKLPRTEPNSTKLKGTLVYNPRTTEIPSITVPADLADGAPAHTTTAHPGGVLHDPTAIMYVRVKDLELRLGASPNCGTSGKLEPDKIGEACPASNLRIKATAPVEPLTLRAAAGECIKVTLYNWLDKNGAPDMMTYRALAPVIPSNPDQPNGSVLNANNIRTSNIVGLHPALVAYDVTEDDGAAIGINDDERNLVNPGRKIDYEWYAGDISLKPKPSKEGEPRDYEVVHTPVEFGGVSLMAADKIKQGQKGLVGALVIEPAGSRWNDSACDDNAPATRCTLDQVTDHQGGLAKRDTRLSVDVVTQDGHKFRDLVAVIQKGLTQLYGDGLPVEGIKAEGVVTEDTEDGGAMAINYGSEPLWFRFGLPPNLPFTGGASTNGDILSFKDVPNAHEAYSSRLLWRPHEDRGDPGASPPVDCGVGGGMPPCASGEPAVPVLTAKAGEEVRMHVILPSGSARGSVFNLHGHVWQRAPYNCPTSSYLGLPGACPSTGFFPTLPRQDGLPPFEVASRGIGPNPMSMYLGGQDSVLPASHFDIVAQHAGGANGVKGDYLYKDQASFGNLGGLWGILRVQ